MELDDRIVERLVAAGAKATFFVSGRWAEAVPDGVRRLAQEPSFEIGNHSHRHRHLRGLGDAAIRADLAATQELLADQTGHRPRWFQFQQFWESHSDFATPGACRCGCPGR